MKALFFLITCIAFFLPVIAQVSPTKTDYVELRGNVLTFLSKVTDREKMCKQKVTILEENEIMYLYLSLIQVDSSYISKWDEKETRHKHHPYVACIFQDPNVQNSLKQILNHPAYAVIISDKINSTTAFDKMTNYYKQLLIDYEVHE